jgi:hypothetical protein
LNGGAPVCGATERFPLFKSLRFAQMLKKPYTIFVKIPKCAAQFINHIEIM